MSFVKRLWKDRISQYPNRRTINDGYVTKTVTVGRSEGTITEAGTPFNASNMNDLEDRIYAAIEQGGGGGGSGTYNYSELINKPRINNNELNGNKSTTDLGIYGSNIQMSAIDTTKVADRILACDVQIFNRADVLLNVMGGTLRGFGSAVVYMQNGIARIDFNIKVSVDETVANVGTWGINRDYFTALTGKTITPLEGGVVTYYHNEQIYTSRIDFGGTFLVSGQFWKPARVYDDNGTKKVGGWNSNVFASGDRFIGTCYGTYT